MSKQRDGEITVTVSGLPDSGKTTIAEMIAQKLKGVPMGYDVFIEEDGMMDPEDLQSAHNYKYPKKPHWDAKVRPVRIITEISD